ncbi:MAG: 50S ribosomal protein L9 [Anaeroplasmataceae bacterium]|nr:50S ribosomal protein L9 [Anaeroplasmataceae bacterium]
MKKFIATLVSISITVICVYFTYFFHKDAVLFYVFLALSILFLSASIVTVMLLFNKKNIEKITWLENRLNVWNSISHHVSAAGDEAFTKLPIGIIVYDSSMEVKWANDYAKQVFKDNLINSSLDSITSGFIDEIKEGKEQMLITAYESTYDVVHNVENQILYFFDVTYREETLRKYNNRITAFALIDIDNLEESLKRYDMQEQSNIRGQILGVISDWLRNNGCCLENLSSNQMLAVFDHEALNKMIADKFSVLNSVRAISDKNHLKASMSMGVACFDVEASELITLAQNAIELAAKRGGDQVVVNIQNQKIQYFGGNTNSLEKNTLVEARIQTMALKEAIENSSNVIIMCHNLADCDAIGSMLGVWYLASTSTKDCKMVFEPKLADVTVQKIFEQIKNHTNKSIYNGFITKAEAKDLIKPDTLLIMTDTQSPRLAMFPDILDSIKNVSVIDHHRASDAGYSETISYYVETYASSTVELVSEMFLFYNKSFELDPFVASIMLAGIVVDTNNFTYRTRTRTFEAASTLNTMGADMVLVRRMLRDSYEEEKRLAEAMVNAMIYEKRFAIVAEPNDTIIPDRTTLAKISDKLLTIEGIEVAFTIGRIDKDTVGISARSNDINVQIIMEEMEGGGHFNAAATQLKGITVEKARERLLEIIRRDYIDTGDGKMKVILISDVKGKGKKDDILEVANGYGNFLITNNLAVLATEENLKKLAEAKEEEKIANENRRNVLEKLKAEIQDKFISVYIKVGADGKNFGHITTKYICEEFENQTGIHLDKKKVELPAEINSVGIFTANVRLDKDIVATFEINVIEK